MVASPCLCVARVDDQYLAANAARRGFFFVVALLWGNETSVFRFSKSPAPIVSLGYRSLAGYAWPANRVASSKKT